MPTRTRQIENYKHEGTVIRSKEKIILNEEKPTKFFYSLEKQKQRKENITKLKDENDKTFKKSNDILNECTNYYQKLYNKQKTCQKTQKELLKHITPKISKTQNQKLQTKIDISEILQAITEMENRKSPGVDGIPIEFYKEFFDISKKDLQTVFNNVLFKLKEHQKPGIVL